MSNEERGKGVRPDGQPSSALERAGKRFKTLMVFTPLGLTVRSVGFLGRAAAEVFVVDQSGKTDFDSEDEELEDE